MFNLPPFATQTWRKGKDETVQTFHNKVKEHTESLSKRGYDVEVEWINANGEVCEDGEDLEVSTICRIVESKEKKDSNGANKDSDWIAEQRKVVEEMRQSAGEER